MEKWLIIFIPIICTGLLLVIGWLWKQSIDKLITKVDFHEKEIPDIKSEIALLKQDVGHFRERENNIVKLFEEKLSIKLDHIDELFKLKLSSLEELIKQGIKDNKENK